MTYKKVIHDDSNAQTSYSHDRCIQTNNYLIQLGM